MPLWFWMRFLRFIPFLLLLGLILFFGLRTSANLWELDWLPRWLVQGGEDPDAWRNTGAYFLLTISVLLAFRRPRWLILSLCGCLVVGVEATQNMLPERWLQWTDVLYGLLGVSLAGAISCIFRNDAEIG
jgi:VanZ family protein